MEEILINLPNELKLSIYNDYYLKELNCNKFLDWLDNNYKISFPSEEIINNLKILLSDKDCLKYLFYKNKYIEEYYYEHYVEDKISFVLMNKIQSFIMCILMKMWH